MNMNAICEGLEVLCESLSLCVPTEHTTIHKSECLYSTDNEYSPDGLYVNLSTFESYGKDLLLYDKNYLNSIYLHITKTLVPIPKNDQIGTALDEENKSLVFREKRLYDEIVDYEIFSPNIGTLPLEKARGLLLEVCEAVINHGGFAFDSSGLSWIDTVKISKYAKDLVQVGNPVKLSLSDFKCRKCGADKNIWLNLSDGYIGCGRKYHDGGGCLDGSEGSAILHYLETGSVYHLVVKIGTITENGADVYSYAQDEDCLVSDPFLADHLATFGINVSELERTEKTTMQLELEKNEKHDWSDVSADSTIYGKGLIGIENLGNSCYINSVVQVLVSIPEFANFFVDNFHDIASYSSQVGTACDDVVLQFAKICVALTTERYVNLHSENIRKYKELCQISNIEYVEPECHKTFSVKSQLLKYAIGKHNVAFNTSEQQDAEEFLSFLINLFHDMEPEINLRCQESKLDIIPKFYFKIRQTVICQNLEKINHTDIDTHILSLPIAQNLEINESDYDQEKEIHLEVFNDKDTTSVTLQKCISIWANDQDINYISETDRKRHHAVLRNSLINLPRYLILKLERFYMKGDWTPGKLNNPVIVPENGVKFEFFNQLDYDKTGYTIEYITGGSKRAKIDPVLFETLISMGFSENASKRAIAAVNSSNVDSCIEWILNHMDEPDEPSATFEEPTEPEYLNIEGEPAYYNVIAFITHIGGNANSGHYLCHVKRDNEWYTINDSKITACTSVPINKGYVYVLERK